MKSMKKVLPALCLLIISAVLLGTSTYAWFSMNSTVAAVGMTVHAKQGGGLYFQIINDGEAFDEELSQIEAVAHNTGKELYPVTVGTAKVDATGSDPASVTPITGTETVNNLKWFTGIAQTSNASTLWGNYIPVSKSASGLTYSGDPAVATLNPLADQSNNQYTMLNVFRIRTNPAVGVTGNATTLTISEISIQDASGNDASKSMLSAVRLLVVVEGGYGIVFDATGERVAGHNGKDVNNHYILHDDTDGIPNDENGLRVYTYIFFDGDDPSVRDNNTSANGYDVSFTLEVVAPAYVAP